MNWLKELLRLLPRVGCPITIPEHQCDDNHEDGDEVHDPDVVTHESHPPWAGSLSDHHQAPGNPLD